jgi:hypothetical protein
MLFPEYHNRFRYIVHVSLRKWVFINQQEFFLLSISKKKELEYIFFQKNARGLHVQLCSEFTALLHVHHVITVPRGPGTPKDKDEINRREHSECDG